MRSITIVLAALIIAMSDVNAQIDTSLNAQFQIRIDTNVVDRTVTKAIAIGRYPLFVAKSIWLGGCPSCIALKTYRVTDIDSAAENIWLTEIEIQETVHVEQKDLYENFWTKAQEAALRKKYGTDWQQMGQGRVKIGWNRDKCKLSWGTPYAINRTITASHLHEQWVYYNSRFLYFTDGILKTIQD